MKELYKEMCDRLKHLESQEQTEEIKWRISEITLAIVRVQQILLAKEDKSDDHLSFNPPYGRQKRERKKTGIWGQDIDECDKFFKSITKNAGPRDQ